MSRLGNWISSKLSAPDPETVSVSCIAYIDNDGTSRVSFRTFGTPKTSAQRWMVHCWESELSTRRLVRVNSAEQFSELLDVEEAV